MLHTFLRKIFFCALLLFIFFLGSASYYTPASGFTNSIQALSSAKPSLDGVSNSGFQSTSSDMYQITLTTFHAKDIIVAILNDYNFNTFSTSNVVSISDSSNLVWKTRINSAGPCQDDTQCPPDIFYAYATTALSSDLINITTSQPSTEYQLTVFAFHGVSSFDNGSGLPSIAKTIFGGQALVSARLSQGGEVILAYFNAEHGADQIVYPSGYRSITVQTTGDWFYLAYKVLPSTKTSVKTSWLISPDDYCTAIDDALQ